MGYGSHIGSIRLKHYALQRYCSSQSLRKVTLLECQHTTDAQTETVKRKQFLSLMSVAREAMEHATHSLFAAKDMHYIVLGLTAVYHQRKGAFTAPLHLNLERLLLLVLKFAGPVVVKTYLAYCYPRDVVKMGPQLGKHLPVVRLHILGMEAYHTPTHIGIGSTNIFHRSYRSEVDARYEEHLCSRGYGT